MWSFLLLGGGPCFRDSASLSCGRAILVPRNALLLALTAATSGGGAGTLGPCSLGGEGFQVPHARLPGLWRAQWGKHRACGIGGLLSGVAWLFLLLSHKSSLLRQGQEPVSNCGTKNRPSPSSRGRGRVAQGLCLICSVFPRLRAAPEAVVGTSTFWKKRKVSVCVCVWSLRGVIFSTPLSAGPCNWAPLSHFPLWPLD